MELNGPVSLCALLAAACAAAPSPPVVPQEPDSGPPPRPNIVLFLADDVGWNSVGYHSDLVDTPNIDRLVEEGVELDSFYVEPLCTPTRAALLTGRYPIRYGLQFGVLRPWSPHGLDTGERLLSEVLRDAGYETAIVGKWHLGFSEEAFLPTRRGFEHQYGCFTGSVDYRRHERMHGVDWHRDDETIHERGHATALIGKECIRLIEERDPARPLFLYVPFTAAHGPLEPPREWMRRYRKEFADEDFAAYAALIAHMDSVIGEVLEAIDREGMRENTLVLFLSDNGGQQEVGHIANQPLHGRKGDFYEGGVRVPAAARWPTRIPAGSKVEGLLHVVDLFPTLAGIAGADLEGNPALDGIDQWETLSGKAPSPRTEMLLGINHVSGAVREGRWKLLSHHRREGRERIELYDIVADPTESKDLALDHPEVVAKLKARLDAYRSESVPELALPTDGGQPEDFVAPEEWGPERAPKRPRGTRRGRGKKREAEAPAEHG